MAVEIKVPTLGESITEATVAQWMKKEGDSVEQDEAIVELETDKVTLEVNAPVAGTISEIVHDEGDEVEVGAILGRIEEGDGKGAKKDSGKEKSTDAKKADGEDTAEEKDEKDGRDRKEAKDEKSGSAAKSASLSPAVRKLVAENDLDPDEIPATGKGGRLTKGDVLAYLEDEDEDETEEKGEAEPEPEKEPAAKKEEEKEARAEKPREAGEREERVRMSRLRKRIAERLKDAQDTAAILTTFNDVDMSAVMDTREIYRDAFEKKHGVKLGFMSFFVKASIVALNEIPAVNAEIDGDDIVYRNHYDIGVAVGTEQGLVVPVVRDADRMSFAEIESTITDLGTRARDGKLTMEDLTGGTFTISNGGIYGSMLSTPILNPPQSGILGMHRIEKRPVVIDDEIVIRPMMYLALSYDHRLVDGREAVTFLRRIKECLEDPQRILLDM